MNKKGLLLLLCLALVSTLAVNGTLASTIQGLFQTVADILTPSPTNSPSDFNVTLVSGSNGVLAPAHYNGEFEWGKIAGAVSHTTYVKNDNTNKPAYVRITIAVKQMDVLKHTEPVMATATLADYATSKQVITIDGEDFLLYTFDYTKPLAANAQTPTISMNFALTKETTNADLQVLGTQFVRVQSFAIQADAFTKTVDGKAVQMTATEALEAALGKISKFNPYQ